MELVKENTVLVNEGVVAQIMINRPQSLNAVTQDVFQGLISAFERVKRYPNLKVVTLWGAGDKAFAAGTEVSSIKSYAKRAFGEYVELACRAIRTIERCEVPVIAAVNGFCFGAGLEIALASDIIVATANAQFGFPDVELGGIPPFGGIPRLIQRVGVGYAKYLLFSGELISSEEACSKNLIDKISEPGRLTNQVDALADKISKHAPLAIAAIKRIVMTEQENNYSTALRSSTERFLDLVDTSDWEEGLNAFMQKTTPKFTGH